MATVPKVILLCDDAVLDEGGGGGGSDGGGGASSPSRRRPTASSISDALITKFGVEDVSCRSSSAPPDRFLETARELADSSVVYAALTDGDAVASASPASEPSPAEALIDVLDRESPSPVLRLPIRDGDTAIGCALRVARLCSPSSPSVRSLVSLHLGRERQARLVRDAQVRTTSASYSRRIGEAYDAGWQITGDGVDFAAVLADGGEGDGGNGRTPPERMRGKVRDRYDLGDRLALVTTDRQSGFDRMLALVPYKGAVLNLVSRYWFERTEHIVPNHLVSVPHPNVSIVRKCEPFPIEFVVRAYMTGSTSTSIWKNYENGVRKYCGHVLPEGMKKNQKLEGAMLTPTTKEEEHDRPISASEIVSEGWMSAKDFASAATAALDVFAFGQRLAAERGLILVDTKYEFGRDVDGTIRLIDEVNTPDSSRYWLASSYEDRIAAGLEPENVDKEFLRLWFRDNCDPYKDEALPEAPRDLVAELSRRYIALYEMITWREFQFDDNAEEKIAQAIWSSCVS